MTFEFNKNAGYDLISMGEVMLRLDPGEGRIKTREVSGYGRAAANTMSQEVSKSALT